jgi:hypothetical protein
VNITSNKINSYEFTTGRISKINTNPDLKISEAAKDLYYGSVKEVGEITSLRINCRPISQTFIDKKNYKC